MLLCPVRPCCRAICIVGRRPPARPCHRFCCYFKGRGQRARHLRQGGVRHGARSPRAEWRHDAGRRCQNRLIDPELEYAAITNNDLKSPASVDSDLPALAGAVGVGADGHSQREQGGCTYPERASWGQEVPSDHETPEAFARSAH